MEEAVRNIRAELSERLEVFRGENRLLEAQRLEQRTMYDLELLAEMGFCPGIENYSRHLTGRAPGEPPPTLLDYFPRRLPAVRRREPRHRPADRRHVPRRPLAQGDAGRVRLPAALARSTTGRSTSRSGRGSRRPGGLRLGHAGRLRARASSGGLVVEQLIRPTGLIDPEIEVRKAGTQVDDLLDEIRKRVERRRARAGDLPDQEDGRGPDRLLPGPRRAGALPALGHRDHRARRDHPQPAQGRVRRAGRHQPAARGARPARGLAGRDPRRRQGRVPALGALADPDHRPRRAQRRRAR